LLILLPAFLKDIEASIAGPTAFEVPAYDPVPVTILNADAGRELGLITSHIICEVGFAASLVVVVSFHITEECHFSIPPSRDYFGEGVSG
jgi:hypothetical protein